MVKEILRLTTASCEETEALGAKIARLALDGKFGFIALYGDLGAGKTALTRGIASVIVPDAPVSSPTYTLVNEYESENGDCLFHFDMYRIEDEDSLESIGFYDYFDRGGMIVTEWSENIPFALPDRYIKAELVKDGEKREITVSEVTGQC